MRPVSPIDRATSGRSRIKSPRSESEAQPELPLTHLSQGRYARDLAADRSVHGRVGLAEIHVVERIDQLGAELRAQPLHDHEVLVQRGVGLEEVRSEERIPPDRPECADRWSAPRTTCAAV